MIRSLFLVRSPSLIARAYVGHRIPLFGTEFARRFAPNSSRLQVDQTQTGIESLLRTDATFGVSLSAHYHPSSITFTSLHQHQQSKEVYIYFYISLVRFRFGLSGLVISPVCYIIPHHIFPVSIYRSLALLRIFRSLSSFWLHPPLRTRSVVDIPNVSCIPVQHPLCPICASQLHHAFKPWNIHL